MFVNLRNYKLINPYNPFRRITIPFVLSGILTAFFLLNAILQVRANTERFNRDKTTAEKLGEFSLPSYACTMFLVYVYQFLLIFCLGAEEALIFFILQIRRNISFVS